MAPASLKGATPAALAARIGGGRGPDILSANSRKRSPNHKAQSQCPRTPHRKVASITCPNLHCVWPMPQLYHCALLPNPATPCLLLRVLYETNKPCPLSTPARCAVPSIGNYPATFYYPAPSYAFPPPMISYPPFLFSLPSLPTTQRPPNHSDNPGAFFRVRACRRAQNISIFQIHASHQLFRSRPTVAHDRGYNFRNVPLEGILSPAPGCTDCCETNLPAAQSRTGPRPAGHPSPPRTP